MTVACDAAGPIRDMIVVSDLFDRRPRIDLYYRDSNLVHGTGVVGRMWVVRDGLPDALEADRPLCRRGGHCLRDDLLPFLRRTANRGARG